MPQLMFAKEQFYLYMLGRLWEIASRIYKSSGLAMQPIFQALPKPNLISPIYGKSRRNVTSLSHILN